MAKRNLTDAAKAAAMIRKELKAHKITARVRSSNYSMGSSVDIYVSDLLPATVDKIKEYCGQFEYGHFDSMQDLYVYSNVDKDLPQARHVMVNNEYSERMYQNAWTYTRAYYGLKDMPDDYASASNMFSEKLNESIDRLIWRVLTGQQKTGFWRHAKQQLRITATVAE